MINATLIQQLKQSNISKDGPKTSARVQEIWKAASAADKQTVCDLAGSAKATVYRVFKTGGVSAKLAIAIAQVMQVDPLYLTGEAEERGSYSVAAATALLSRLGYDKLLIEQDKAQRRAQREAARQQKEAAAEAAQEAAPAPEAANEKPAAAAKEAPSSEIVTSEDLFVLFKSLEIRAKAGIPQAKELLRQIKLLLLGDM